MRKRGDRKLERARKNKIVKKMERRLGDAKAAAFRIQKFGEQAAKEVTDAAAQLEQLNRQREVLLRVIAVVTAERGGELVIPYSLLLSAPPILVETPKDGEPGRVRITLLPAEPAPDPAGPPGRPL